MRFPAAHLGAPTAEVRPTPPNAKPPITILKRPASTAEIWPTPPDAEPAITTLKRPASKVQHEMMPKSQVEITQLLHQVMAVKDYKVSSLEREKLVLVNELEQLKHQLKTTEEKPKNWGSFYRDLQKGKYSERWYPKCPKVQKIETNSKKEAEKCLAWRRRPL